MDPHLICTWLSLPKDVWPPDHYRLLGLNPGEADTERIEREVHARLEIVRRYQLAQQEEATEAMNRLAQAFVCLTDPEARKAYDAQQQGGPPTAKDPLAGPKEPADPDLLDDLPPTAVVPTRMAWNAGGKLHRPPARSDHPALSAEPPYTPEDILEEAASAGPAGKDSANGNLAPASAAALVGIPEIPDVPPPSLRDSAVTVPRPVLPTRRTRSTRRTLYRRIAQTRQLARAWEEAGNFVSRPTARISRPFEALELIRQATAIQSLVSSFPSPVGEAGHPGYLVVTLARQPAVVPAFQTLQPGQREALARDWRAGMKILTAHREFLRQEVRALRRPRSGDWLIRAGRALRDRPGVLLLLLGLLALGIARLSN
jgi:hypothetical protein